MRLVRVALLFLLLLGLVGSAYGQDPTTPSSARLDDLRFEFQTWCNCGPVNLTMALSYFGWQHDQTAAAGWLKPRVEDKNVSPDQLVAFVYHQTDLPLGALWRYGGTLDQIKQFIAAGFPVIIESGFQPQGHEWMGHYMTIVAYDDAPQTVWVYDSYEGLGPDYLGIQHSYAALDADWRHFNRAWIVVYPLDRESEVLAMLGPLVDPLAAASSALKTALEQDAPDQWTWFNAGTSAVMLGQVEDAALYYDEAFRLGLPFRMLWYQFGPYEAYYRTGRYYDVIRLANETEAITTEIEETIYWRGLAYAALNRTGEALADLNNALIRNPNFDPAWQALAQIEAGTYVVPAPLRTVRPDLP